MESSALSERSKTSIEARRGVGLQLLAFSEVLLLSIWLGSMVFFSFAVAPGAFAVLPTRHLAGLVVTRSIHSVELLGLVIGPLLMLIQGVSWPRSAVPARITRLVLIIVMVGSAALSRFTVSPAMESLRASMGGIVDEVSATDPLRVQFNVLHQYSVGLMTLAMLAGLAVLFLTVRSWLKR